MGNYTPDGIHIYSEAWFYLPPAIALLGLVFLVAFLVLRRRTGPQSPWLTVFLICTILGTLFFTFRAFALSAWSIHAWNHVEEGRSQGQLRKEILMRTDISLSKDFHVEAAVTMGWREYESWFCIRGGSEALRSQVTGADYTARSGSEIPGQPIPQAVTDWIQATGFRSGSSYSRKTAGSIETISFDENQNLAILTSNDF